MRPHGFLTTNMPPPSPNLSSSSSSSHMATLPFTTNLSSSYHRSFLHSHHKDLSCLRCCNNGSPDPEEDLYKHRDMKNKKRMGVGKRLLMGAERVRESLRPKQKGDWKDVALMSLSFAIYVYISQRIVCAYCAWMDMLHHGF